MKKVLLISPSVEEASKVKIPEYKQTYSLGLAYLHAVIEPKYEITTKNYNNYFTETECIEDVRKLLQEEKPDYLLIQMFTFNRVCSYKIITMCRLDFPRVKIIVGGIHASIMYRQLLENYPQIDAVVIGEGEVTIMELLDAFDNGRDLQEINGIAYNLFTGDFTMTPERELIQDLDSLPFPNHRLFMSKQRKKAFILSSRGCPAACSFCCLGSISKRRFRKRSAKNVFDEIIEIKTDFPWIEEIEFSDDTFTLDNDRVKELCKMIIVWNTWEPNINNDHMSRPKPLPKFICSARVKPIDREMFELMERAGFKLILFGLETGSPKLMKENNKGITRDDVRALFKCMEGINKRMKIAFFMMVGFPGENDETVNESIEFVKELQNMRPFPVDAMTPLMVYPNTQVFRQMKEAGKIDESYWLTDKDVPHYTVDHTHEELLVYERRFLWAINIHKGRFYMTKRIVKTAMTNPKLLIQAVKHFGIKNR